MNKIIRALLEAKYPTMNIDSLLEVISNTPNPEVATEIVCGLFEEPWVAIIPSLKFETERKSQFEFELIRYNKWDNCVEYRYKSKKNKSIWHEKGTDLPLYNDLKPYQSEYYFKDYIKKSDIEGADILSELEINAISTAFQRITIYGDMETSLHQNTCSVKDWNGDLLSA